MCWDQDSDLGRLAPLVLQTNVFDRSTIPAKFLCYYSNMSAVLIKDSKVSKKDRLNLSADLMRIGEWLYKGENELADQFLSSNKAIARRLKLDEWWQKIQGREGGQKRAAERALTLAAISA